MAITCVDYAVAFDLMRSGMLPRKPAMLELGESNWYNDIELTQLAKDIAQYITDEERKKILLAELKAIAVSQSNDIWFRAAKIFYKAFFDYSELVSVDLQGSAEGLKLDLNEPIKLKRKFDIVMNIGTAEHVFNTYQFFKTVHEYTVPGGFMLHELPSVGWVDHGFYNFQPTFFFDLAAANGYDIRAMIYGEIDPFRITRIHTRESIAGIFQEKKLGTNAMIFAVFKKPATAEQPFKVPMQGYYFSEVSEEVKKTWVNMR